MFRAISAPLVSSLRKKNALFRMPKLAPNHVHIPAGGIFCIKKSHDSSNRTPICIRGKFSSRVMGKVCRKGAT
jgi:hypothetical protein